MELLIRSTHLHLHNPYSHILYDHHIRHRLIMPNLHKASIPASENIDWFLLDKRALVGRVRNYCLVCCYILSGATRTVKWAVTCMNCWIYGENYKLCAACYRRGVLTFAVARRMALHNRSDLAKYKNYEFSWKNHQMRLLVLSSKRLHRNNEDTVVHWFRSHWCLYQIVVTVFLLNRL